jgi:protein phosphatase
LDRIALISDIHGNIPALEAVLQNIRKRQIKRIFCLGDLVGKGPYPEKAIDICRSECEKVIIGNWDDIASRDITHPLISWQQQRLDKERRDYLKNLPNTVEFRLSGRKIRLLHSSQIGVMHRIQRNAPDNVQLAMFGNTAFTGDTFEPDIIGYADIHIVFLKQFGEKILFNIGSVGNPLDYPQSSYAVIEGNYDSNKADAFSINIIRVPYDIELSIRQAAAEKLPDLERYADELRTAVYGGDPTLHQ